MKKNLILGIGFLISLQTQAQWTTLQLKNNPSIRSIDASSLENIWVSGSKGSIFQSQDSGKTWINLCPEEYQHLDFRGIAVLNEKTLLAMSAGDGSEGKALIIKSSDSGKTWKKVLEKKEKGIFFDSIKFKDSTTGYIIGDPIDNQPYLLKTIDAGETWSRVPNLPEIQKGDASYAASNSCITFSNNNIWFHTQDRVFHSENNGIEWKAYPTPFKKDSSKGIFGIFSITPKKLIIVGGDYLPNEEKQLQYAYSNNKGKGWHFTENFWRVGLTEAISTFNTKNHLISVGTHGSSISKDLGKTWNLIDQESFHVVKCLNNQCIAAGANGNIGLQKF